MSSVTTSGTRGPYAKTAVVRQRIIEAGTEVFAESGFRATTMKDIAERAGISEGGLAHHFANKSEMLEEVLAARERQAGERFPVTGGIDILQAMLVVLDEDSSRPGMVELHSILSAEATSPEHPAHDHYQVRYSSVRAYVRNTFEELDKQGELQTVLTPSDLAAAYIALSDGLQLQWLYDREAIDATGILRRFLASVIPRFAELASE